MQFTLCKWLRARGVFSLLSPFLTTYQLILFITGSPCNNLPIIMWLIMVSFKGKGPPASHLVPQFREPFPPYLYPSVLTIRLSTQKYLPSASSIDKSFFQPIKLKTKKCQSFEHPSKCSNKKPTLIQGPSLWLGSAPMSQLAYSGKAKVVWNLPWRERKRNRSALGQGQAPRDQAVPINVLSCLDWVGVEFVITHHSAQRLHQKWRLFKNRLCYGPHSFSSNT